MPGGDGTGPLGLGSKTGRGAGYCAGYPVAGYMNSVPGRGRGFGRGWGRGRGWNRGWYGYGPAWGYPNWATPAYGNPYAPEFTPKQEAQMLREEAKAMQSEIDSINQRITELESAEKKTKQNR
jgi:hypothetical protein